MRDGKDQYCKFIQQPVSNFALTILTVPDAKNKLIILFSENVCIVWFYITKVSFAHTKIKEIKNKSDYQISRRMGLWTVKGMEFWDTFYIFVF